MRISVIVPTYNRQELLKQTLYYLRQQELQEFFALEIIIVDDGSTDGTQTFMNEYQNTISNLIYIYRSRDPAASGSVSARNPASIRNLGIQRSSGDLLLFLDCGVLLPPSFLGCVAQRYRTSPQQVLVHYTVGLLASPSERNQRLLTNLTPTTIFEQTQRLAQDPEWMDSREGVFVLTNDQLDRLPAPWTLAWSCALSIPKSLLEKVGEFDEAFQGWGGEDTDLGYRLYQAGASFAALRECIALHLPHNKLSKEDRQASDRMNRKKLHKKVQTLATELYYYYPGPYYNQVLAYYNHLVLTNIVPLYALELLDNLKNALCQDKAPSLLIGTDCKFIAESLPTTHNFVHNLATFTSFCQWFPEREIRYLLGCDTFYPEKYFEVVILTDFIRSLPSTIRRDLFKELQRISQNIFFLYTSDYIPLTHEIDEYPWSSLHEIEQQLEFLPIQMVCISEIHGTSLFKASIAK